MSVGSFLWGHFLYSLFQSSIVTLKQNHVLRQQLSVNSVTREGIIRIGLNTIFLFLEKDGLAISLCTRIAVKYEALILAGCCIELHAEDLVKHLVREAHFYLRSIKFGVLLLISCLFIFSHSNIFEFLDFGTDFISERILEFHSLCNQITDSNDGNTV